MAFGGLGGEAGEFGPGGDEAVVGEGVGGPVLALAGVVEAVGQFAGGFGEAADLAKEVGGGHLAAGFKFADQVLDDFPDGEAVIAGRGPVVFEFVTSKQADFAGVGGGDTGVYEACDGGVAGTWKAVRRAHSRQIGNCAVSTR